MCSEAIVQEFSKITLHLNIMYCLPLIQQANTSRSSTLLNEQSLPNSSSFSQSNTQELGIITRLDTFFPFDPLPLTEAKKFTSTLFQEWDGEDSDDDDDTEHDDLLVSDSDLGASMQGVSLEERYSMSMSMSVSLG